MQKFILKTRNFLVKFCEFSASKTRKNGIKSCPKATKKQGQKDVKMPQKGKKAPQKKGKATLKSKKTPKLCPDLSPDFPCFIPPFCHI
jgi:hypothetical protein